MSKERVILTQTGSDPSVTFFVELVNNKNSSSDFILVTENEDVKEAYLRMRNPRTKSNFRGRVIKE